MSAPTDATMEAANRRRTANASGHRDTTSPPPSALRQRTTRAPYLPTLIAHLDRPELRRLGILFERPARKTPEQIAKDVVRWMARQPNDDNGQPASWNARFHSCMNAAEALKESEWIALETAAVVALAQQLRTAVDNSRAPMTRADVRLNPEILQGQDDAESEHLAVVRASDASPAKAVWERMYEQLNTEQREAFDAFKAGENVFLTGSGGTGKSFVIETIRQWIREVAATDPCIHDAPVAAATTTDAEQKAGDAPAAVATSSVDVLCTCFGCSTRVVGPTGLCVLPFRGCTINSFLAIGLGGTLGDWAAVPTGYYQRRIREVRYLIIEEVSMVSADRLDLIDQRMRLVRHEPTKLFGGVQLLVVGDFGQLPPVPSVKRQPTDLTACEEAYQKFRQSFRQLLQTFFPGAPETHAVGLPPFHEFRRGHAADNTTAGARLTEAYDDVAKLHNALRVRSWGYAFRANAWKAISKSVLLKEPMRFKTAASSSSVPTMADQRQKHHPTVLDELRVGNTQSAAHFSGCVTPAPAENALHLTYTNEAALKRNMHQLQQHAPLFEYKHLTFKLVEPFVGGAVPPERSTAERLADAEVTQEVDKELDDMAFSEIVLCLDAPVILTRNLDMNPKKSVMLANGSRGFVVGWQSIQDAVDELEAFAANIQAIIDNPATEPADLVRRKNFLATLQKKVEFLQAGQSHLPDCLPIVRFTSVTADPDGTFPTREEVILPEVYELKDMVNGARQEVVHKWRYQLPLKLGWAVTVHKSQGMTLDAAYVNNARPAFAFGQLYVAVSRVRTVARLQLARPIDRASNLAASPQVIAFYASDLRPPSDPPSIDWISTTTAELGGILYDEEA